MKGTAGPFRSDIHTVKKLAKTSQDATIREIGREIDKEVADSLLHAEEVENKYFETCKE